MSGAVMMDKNEHDSQYWFDMLTPTDIVSATECTGMIQTPPLTEEEVYGYLDIFHVPQQRAVEAQKKDNPEEQGKRS